MGSPRGRQICLAEYSTDPHLQFVFCRPLHVRNRCNGTELGKREQFCESAFLHDQQNFNESTRSTGTGNPDWALVAKSTLVPAIKENGHMPTIGNPKQKWCDVKVSYHTRAETKFKLEDLRLANIWRGTLIEQGWNDDTVKRLILNWVLATMDSYSRCVNKFIQFSLHGVDPQFIPSGLLAEFFTDIARRSDHPKSILDVNSAALACYYQALDHPSPIDSDVRKLIAGLVKSDTTQSRDLS